MEMSGFEKTVGVGTAIACQSPTRKSVVLRHARGLSLNFPVLLPTQQPVHSSMEIPAESTVLSTNVANTAIASPTLTTESWRGSPLARQLPFSPPSRPLSPTRRPADFLTLIAAQERKVLELKEELNKAETELNTLKKQWTAYEANKKREELRHARTPQSPVIDENVAAESQDPEDIEEERLRRRALVEMNNNVNNPSPESVEAPSTTKLGRRGSKRIFEGRHTRTLSLLSPLGPTQVPSSMPVVAAKVVDTQTRKKSTASVSEESDLRPVFARMPTLDSIISAESIQQGLGKTYKELAAAHRRSLPPAAADIIVKQGKQVVDGVRDGLWMFFEDIRQATVGDEAVNKTVEQKKSNKPGKQSGHIARSKTKSTKSGMTGSGRHSENEKRDSFWKEFGFDTPDKKGLGEANKEDRSGHIQKKDSTDSQNIPDLLVDVNGVEGDEEDWDAWESPVNTRDAAEANNSTRPELSKLTPSKLTRTVSDLMKEWETGPEGVTIAETDAHQQARLLSNSHF